MADFSRWAIRGIYRTEEDEDEFEEAHNRLRKPGAYFCKPILPSSQGLVLRHRGLVVEHAKRQLGEEVCRPLDAKLTVKPAFDGPWLVFAIWLSRSIATGKGSHLTFARQLPSWRGL